MCQSNCEHYIICVISPYSADSPVLWLRLDPDVQLVRTVHFEQPDYMWQYQLKFERCIVAQFEVTTCTLFSLLRPVIHSDFIRIIKMVSWI